MRVHVAGGIAGSRRSACRSCWWWARAAGARRHAGRSTSRRRRPRRRLRRHRPPRRHRLHRPRPRLHRPQRARRPPQSPARARARPRPDPPRSVARRPSRAAPGSTVAWTGPNAPTDYVTIVPAGASAWTDESFFYTSAGSPGTLVAPDGGRAVRAVVRLGERQLGARARRDRGHAVPGRVRRARLGRRRHRVPGGLEGPERPAGLRHDRPQGREARGPTRATSTRPTATPVRSSRRSRPAHTSCGT